MSEPFFSVVIPTYNRADTVGTTLDALWQQSCQDFEVILVDDGSSDNTADVVGQISDPRLVYVTQDNAGPARARNHGVERASGRYIAFLDSDDRWYAEHLSQARTMIEKDNLPFLYSQIIVDRGVGRYWVKPSRAISTHEDIFDYLFIDGGFIQTSTIIVDRSVCQQVQWDESVTYGDNDQYVIDLCLAGIRPVMMPVSQTLYADAISADALSQLPVFGGSSKQYTNFFNYMDSRKSQMSESAQIAFAAYVESVSDAGTRPLTAIGKIVRGWRAGVVSLPGMARQMIQCFMPRSYRRLVDVYVRYRGKALADLLPDT